MSLTESQRWALKVGSTRWLSQAGGGPHGTTMDALARRGLADVRILSRPYEHRVYRLTPEGVRLRDRLFPAPLAWPELHYPAVGPPDDPAQWPEEWRPVPSVGVRCRCPGCGAEYGDAVPSARCETCWTPVEAVAT